MVGKGFGAYEICMRGVGGEFVRRAGEREGEIEMRVFQRYGSMEMSQCPQKLEV